MRRAPRAGRPRRRAICRRRGTIPCRTSGLCCRGSPAGVRQTLHKCELFEIQMEKKRGNVGLSCTEDFVVLLGGEGEQRQLGLGRRGRRGGRDGSLDRPLLQLVARVAGLQRVARPALHARPRLVEGEALTAALQRARSTIYLKNTAHNVVMN